MSPKFLMKVYNVYCNAWAGIINTIAVYFSLRKN